MKWASLTAKAEKLFGAKEKSLVGLTPGVDPTKLFFFLNEEFFRFLHLSLAVVH